MPDGQRPTPDSGSRNEIVTGRGGAQILLEHPAGNLIELFQPAGS
jgi:hypothetical protein